MHYFTIQLILFVFILTGCGTRYQIDENPEEIHVCALPQPARVALVLGGGGARGMSHVGVLAVFEEAGIPIDFIVGCSAGSIVGALYADYPDSHRLRKVLEPLKKWDILDISLAHSRYGFVQGRSLRNFLRYTMTARCFHQLQIPLYVVATDIMSGELITFSYGPIIPTVHASSAIPFVFAPVTLCGRLLVDGGVADPIPVTVAKKIGADVVIAVDLSELLPQTCPTNLFGVAKRSSEIVFLLQSESCACDADVIIKPELPDIGMFDDKNHELMYQAGRKAALEAMPKIMELLHKTK